MNKFQFLSLFGLALSQGAYAVTHYDMAGLERYEDGTYANHSYSREPERPTPYDNRQSLERWEFIARTKHASITQGLLNKETRAQAREAMKKLEYIYYGKELNQIKNSIFLFAIRETAKYNDFRTASDIIQACCVNLESGDKVHFYIQMAVERGYVDIYEFLIEHDPNPRAQINNGFTLMDLLDQGQEKYGNNSNYQKIEQDLLRRGVRFNRRGGGCCEIM